MMPKVNKRSPTGLVSLAGFVSAKEVSKSMAINQTSDRSSTNSFSRETEKDSCSNGEDLQRNRVGKTDVKMERTDT